MKGVSQAQANGRLCVYLQHRQQRQAHCFFLHAVTTESPKPDLEDFVSTSRNPGLIPNPL